MREKLMSNAGRAFWLIGFMIALGVAVGTAVEPLGAQELKEYRIGAGDKLNITVFGHADVSGEFVVDGLGRLSLPLLGLIDVDTMTIAELQTFLTAALDRDFIVDPRVSIEIGNYRPFYILGQVNSPGSYSFIEGMTVRMAVALAGGFTRRAQEEAVTIIRANDRAREPVEAPMDAPVLPGDTIEVDRRLF